MTFVEVALGCALFAVLIFVSLHLRPLSEDEVLELSRKRRRTEIRKYFTYFQGPAAVNKEFKTKMNQTGQLYSISDSLSEFPARAAGLIKGKKHEWVICGFEREKMIDLIWLNKGIREQVSIQLEVNKIIQVATNGGYTSVLRFHNHPNSNPDRYDLLGPSDQDMISTRYYKDILNGAGLNFLDFVCERGRYREFTLSAAACFIPLKSCAETVQGANGKSRLENFLLHMERVF